MGAICLDLDYSLRLNNSVDFNSKVLWFTKTSLLIIVPRIVIDDWNTINKGMLVEKKVINVVLILLKGKIIRDKKF
jgi:hypothetical protein